MPDYAVDCHTKAGRVKNEPMAIWYQNRHDKFGVPVNKYTLKLAELLPEWFEGVRSVEDAWLQKAADEELEKKD